MNDEAFWRSLDQLAKTSKLKIDRHRGSTHPRFPAYRYPYDYGYLEGTRSGDGEGIDVWIGSLPKQTVTGIICSVDLDQRDAELKILLGCTPHESCDILHAHSTGAQSAMLVQRPTEAMSEPGQPA